MSEPLSASGRSLESLGWFELTRALAARCRTPRAAADATALLPDLPLSAVDEALDETGEAAVLLESDAGLPTAGAREVAVPLALAARGGVLDGEALLDIAKSVRSIAALRGRLDAAKFDAPLLHARARLLEAEPRLAADIERAIDERGQVRDDASPRLRELLHRRVMLSSRVQERIESLRRDPDIASALTDDIVTIRDDRHVLLVRADRRARVPGILHGRSGSGHSNYIEPAELVELNNELRGVGFDVEEEIARILRDLSHRAGLQSATLALALECHAAIDLAAARARLARELGASRPVVEMAGPLVVSDLGHPLLLLMLGPARASEVILNDVTLEGGDRGLVISGPNAGGKTVLLRALGLAGLMPRAGMWTCTAPGSRIPFLDHVLADIGDAQSIEHSLSSFSGHVARLRDMLATVAVSGPRTLVLIDEIMAGTDPSEGAPLAEAVLEEIVGAGALVVVTTHLGRLKEFAARTPGLVNAGMEFDDATLMATFRMRQGLPGASAALRVAERLGLDGRIVARARALADAATVSAEDLLRDLVEAREETHRALERAHAAELDATIARDALERKLATMASKDATFVRAERAAFERELGELREQAAAITRSLQQASHPSATAEAVRKLEDLRERSRLASRESAPAGGGFAGDLAVGSRVRSRALGREGVVLSPADGRGRVRVQFGALSLHAERDDLEAAGAAGASREAPHVPRVQRAQRETSVAPSDAAPDVPFTPQSPRNTLDMRGMRADEALSEMSRFLERARAGGERSVVLIHGHGTGALKAAVRAELPSESRVAAHRPGGDNEGGDGVTIARLS